MKPLLSSILFWVLAVLVFIGGCFAITFITWLIFGWWVPSNSFAMRMLHFVLGMIWGSIAGLKVLDLHQRRDARR